MFSIFSFIRRRTAEAFAAGAADFMAAVVQEGEEPPHTLEELRAILAAPARALPAAPAPEPEEPAAKKKGGGR